MKYYEPIVLRNLEKVNQWWVSSKGPQNQENKWKQLAFWELLL